MSKWHQNNSKYIVLDYIVNIIRSDTLIILKKFFLIKYDVKVGINNNVKISKISSNVLSMTISKIMSKMSVPDYIIDVIKNDIKDVIKNNIKDVIPDIYRCYQK